MQGKFFLNYAKFAIKILIFTELLYLASFAIVFDKNLLEWILLFHKLISFSENEKDDAVGNLRDVRVRSGIKNGVGAVFLQSPVSMVKLSNHAI